MEQRIVASQDSLDLICNLSVATISLWSAAKNSALRKTLQFWRILQRVLTRMWSISLATPPALLYQIQRCSTGLWYQEPAILNLLDLAKPTHYLGWLQCYPEHRCRKRHYPHILPERVTCTVAECIVKVLTCTPEVSKLYVSKYNYDK